MKKFIALLLVAVLSLTALSALAEWPERAIELIVPANPGGDTDANARALADEKAKVLLVNMDTLFEKDPDEARLLLDTFDLSGLPYVMRLGPGGVVMHRYLEF